MLERYYSLLAKWNARMNLTALPLQPASDEAFDRLLIEPLMAAHELPDGSGNWFDLGSGGGSPAIPLKIVRPALRLTMVEAKARKAAFLREATRTLGLQTTIVENARFEDVAARLPGSATLITLRAVRVDGALATVASQLLEPRGRLLLFRADSQALSLPGLSLLKTDQLGRARRAYLAVFERMFHVEQSD